GASRGRVRDALSFPARRSSDLGCRTWWVKACATTSAAPRSGASPARWTPASGTPSAEVAVIGPDVTCAARLVRSMVTRLSCIDRSEEHTSELQSREMLVCRLLL